MNSARSRWVVRLLTETRSEVCKKEWVIQRNTADGSSTTVSQGIESSRVEEEVEEADALVLRLIPNVVTAVTVLKLLF